MGTGLRHERGRAHGVVTGDVVRFISRDLLAVVKVMFATSIHVVPSTVVWTQTLQRGSLGNELRASLVDASGEVRHARHPKSEVST